MVPCDGTMVILMDSLCYHGILQTYHGTSLCYHGACMVQKNLYHGTLWYTMVHCIYTIVHPMYLQPYGTIYLYDGILWYTIVHLYTTMVNILYHDMLQGLSMLSALGYNVPKGNIHNVPKKSLLYNI